jgi:3-vinyl bacteriochlorophyllide hydratase
MASQAAPGVFARRKASIWTTIHPLFAIGQLLVFFVSIGFLIAYLKGAIHNYQIVNLTVLTKIGLMGGALVTGALWEHDVYGHWWFAPEFLVEDVMTVLVFVTQIAYLLMYYLHPGNMTAILTMLGIAYTMYFANVAQYIHRTQLHKQQAEHSDLKQAA